MIRTTLNRSFPLHLIACIALALVYPTRLDAEVIAFWDFNAPYDAGNDTLQIVHAASIGNGLLYQQRAAIDGNGKGGVAFGDPAVGIVAAAGKSMAWNDIRRSGNDDAEFFAVFSTVGFRDIRVRFDVHGNGNGVDEIVSYDLDYDVNPLADLSFSGGTIKDFAVAAPTSVLNNQSINANGSAFITESVDLSGATAINNQTSVALRFDDFQENRSMRIDNVLITGITAIPEPTSAAILTAMAGISLFRRRRR